MFGQSGATSLWASCDEMFGNVVVQVSVEF